MIVTMKLLALRIEQPYPIIKLLLELGADPNVRNRTSLGNKNASLLERFILSGRSHYYMSEEIPYRYMISKIALLPLTQPDVKNTEMFNRNIRTLSKRVFVVKRRESSYDSSRIKSIKKYVYNVYSVYSVTMERLGSYEVFESTSGQELRVTGLNHNRPHYFHDIVQWLLKRVLTRCLRCFTSRSESFSFFYTLHIACIIKPIIKKFFVRTLFKDVKADLSDNAHCTDSSVTESFRIFYVIPFGYA
ncbi:CRPV-402 [Crowpox virus]|nr:CRPV-002 [Crowpox virus]UWX11511.1 CRPV-402 [Crowpox virus]